MRRPGSDGGAHGSRHLRSLTNLLCATHTHTHLFSRLPSDARRRPVRPRLPGQRRAVRQDRPPHRRAQGAVGAVRGRHAAAIPAGGRVGAGGRRRRGGGWRGGGARRARGTALHGLRLGPRAGKCKCAGGAPVPIVCPGWRRGDGRLASSPGHQGASVLALKLKRYTGGVRRCRRRCRRPWYAGGPSRPSSAGWSPTRCPTRRTPPTTPGTTRRTSAAAGAAKALRWRQEAGTAAADSACPRRRMAGRLAASWRCDCWSRTPR